MVVVCVGCGVGASNASGRGRDYALDLACDSATCERPPPPPIEVVVPSFEPCLAPLCEYVCTS